MKNCMTGQVAGVMAVKAENGGILPLGSSGSLVNQAGMFARIFRWLIVLFLAFQVGHAVATEAATGVTPEQQLKSFRAGQAALLRTALGVLPGDKAPPMLKTFMVLGFTKYDRKDLMAELFHWGMSPNVVLPYRLWGVKETLEITPLTIAVTGASSEDMLRFLVEQGADLEQRFMGTPPLGVALCTGKYAKAELLLDLGANPEAVEDDGTTSLMQLVGCPEGKDKEAYERLMKRLVASGVDINAKDEHGLTVLSHAAILTQVKAVELLLQLGANPNIKSNEGKTALGFAHQILEKITSGQFASKRKASQEKIIQMLKAAGAKA